MQPEEDGRGAAVGGRERGYQAGSFPGCHRLISSGNSWALLCQLLLGSLASSPKARLCARDRHDRGHREPGCVRACAYSLVLLHRVSEDAG